jgi:murein DD-endopeptidase MepM/ murein hydrolase activator NlpD
MGRFRKRISRWLLLVWLVATLACNFPLFRPSPGVVGVEQFRLTLTALALPTLPGATPVPAITGVAVPTPAKGPQAGPPPPAPTAALIDNVYVYPAQSGDTLESLAARFSVETDLITSPLPLAAGVYLPPGQVLYIPNLLEGTRVLPPVLPDSEAVYSPSSADFSIGEYVDEAGGYLRSYQEMVDGETLSGVQIVQKVALENSINPRLLLAFLEYRSGWVLGHPERPNQAHPIGYNVPDYRGLYKELLLSATHLGVGYYGWRSGSLTVLAMPGGSAVRLDPTLNAGSVAVQALFAKFYRPADLEENLYGEAGFLRLYDRMFGEAGIRAVEPLIPPGLAQPDLDLPFAPGERWSFSGGPHLTWNSGSPRGAIDFSPVTGEPPCAPSSAWVTASAGGLVTRSAYNTLVIDLDGDGYEQTGWALLYFHLADRDRVQAGTKVQVDDRLGHPSCERGKATGTHVHFARKYNGEWLPAAGPLPIVLSGWTVQSGARSYEGYLVNGDQVVAANPGGSRHSIIVRGQ